MPELLPEGKAMLACYEPKKVLPSEVLVFQRALSHEDGLKLKEDYETPEARRNSPRNTRAASRIPAHSLHRKHT